MIQPFLSWLYWDPPRDAFTIPFVDMPIAWYGILFAAGFVVGYFIFLPMLARHFNQNRFVLERDVADWHLLIQGIKDVGIPLKLEKRQLLEIGAEPSMGLKLATLAAVNRYLEEQQQDRRALEKLLPAGSLVTTHKLSQAFADKLTWFVVLGTILGARLGHVLFYDWSFYSENPWEILMIRRGGLASHGGTVGVILGVALFIWRSRRQFPDISLMKLMDMLTVPTAFVVCCIRLGNFMNQEILGIASTVPWAIIFGHPAEAPEVVPRHPAQLYEACVYLFSFVILYILWRQKGLKLREGVLCGLFFILIFGSRFFIDFLKLPQGSLLDMPFLETGQLLSLPFILAGAILLTCKRTAWTGPNGPDGPHGPNGEGDNVI